MPPRQIPLAKKSDPARAGIVSAERIVNLYAEATDGSQSGGFFLNRTPGLTELADTSRSQCRGLTPYNDELLSVHSNALLRIAEDGTSTFVGSIPGSDKVIMAANDVTVDGDPLPQVAIVSDAGTWIYQGGALQFLYTPEFPNPNSAEYIDGYIIYTLADGRFIWSSISNALVLDALDFASAEGDPDGLLRCLKVRRELYMMGPKTIEVWQHTADASAPFQRVPGAVLPIGLLATRAACVVAGSLFFIDSNRVVRKLGDGYSAQIISSDYLNTLLSRVEDTSTISMYGYVQSTHKFVVVTWPGGTWVFDELAGVWAERQSYGRDNWQASCYASQWNKHIVGSDISGKIFYLDESNKTEDGQYLVTKVVLPNVGGFPRGGSVHTLDINMETGVGVLSGGTEDTDPEIMLRWSIDGAKTWVSERKHKIGKQGEFGRCIRFTGLGPFNPQGIVFELTCSAAVFNRYVSAFLTVSPRR